GGHDAGAARSPVGIVGRQLGEQQAVKCPETVIGHRRQIVVKGVVTEPDGRRQRAQKPPLHSDRIEQLSKRIGRLPVRLGAGGAAPRSGGAGVCTPGGGGQRPQNTAPPPRQPPPGAPPPPPRPPPRATPARPRRFPP